jgi:site-specific DNA-methyltransferase (adenine-specific)
MKSEVYNIDCMEYMKSVPDKYFDLLIADPPYRDIGENAPQKEMREHGNFKTFGNKPTIEMLSEFARVSKHQIIWGANNFGYPFKGFVTWDKMVRGSDRYSQVEIASLSEGLSTTSKIVAISCYDKNKFHPTQKPIALYEWLLHNYAQQGWVIFDPMFGSGSSRIAAHKLGFDYVGCELDKEYFDKGCERFKQETSQLSLF